VSTDKVQSQSQRLVSSVQYIGLTNCQPTVVGARARREDLAMRKLERLDDREYGLQQLALANKRSSYINLMAAPRRYHASNNELSQYGGRGLLTVHHAMSLRMPEEHIFRASQRRK
jgi:hypothetical protein